MNVKAIYIRVLACLSVMQVMPCMAMAQDVSGQMATDTVRVIKDVKSVVVSRRDSTTTVKVRGTQDDPMFEYTYEVSVNNGKQDKETLAPDWNPAVPFFDKERERKRKKIKSIYFRDIYIGVLMPLDAPEGVDGSFEYGFGSIVGLSYIPWRTGPEFSIGLGFGGNQLCIHNGMMFGKNDDALVLIPRPAAYNSVKSRLESFRFLIPVMISQPLIDVSGYSIGTTVGAIVGFNTYTKAYTEYKIGDVKYRENYKNLQQRVFTVDFMASVGLVDAGVCGLYVKYSPMNMFRSGFGPEFSLLSVGLTVGF